MGLGFRGNKAIMPDELINWSGRFLGDFSLFFLYKNAIYTLFN